MRFTRFCLLIVAAVACGGVFAPALGGPADAPAGRAPEAAKPRQRTVAVLEFVDKGPSVEPAAPWPPNTC